MTGRSRSSGACFWWAYLSVLRGDLSASWSHFLSVYTPPCTSAMILCLTWSRAIVSDIYGIRILNLWDPNKLFVLTLLCQIFWSQWQESWLKYLILFVNDSDMLFLCIGHEIITVLLCFAFVLHCQKPCVKFIDVAYNSLFPTECVVP